MPKIPRDPHPFRRLAAVLLCGAACLSAGVVPLGSGAYTTTFPAGGQNNSLPVGTLNLSGNALTKPVPSSDWWSAFLTAGWKQYNQAAAYNYPLSLLPCPSGLIVNYTVPASGASGYSQPMDARPAIIVGTQGLTAGAATVSDYSDWTVTFSWDDLFQATAGVGMPFSYYTKASTEVAQVSVYPDFAGGVTISGNLLLILNNINGSNYVVYAPAGSTWTGGAGVYTSTLNGQNYWSMALLPPGADVPALTAEYAQYAYVFPANTAVDWSYAPATGLVTTNFTVTPEVMEGTGTTVLQGLLPHQWAHLSASSPAPGTLSYNTVRGAMKMLASNTFTVENTFTGVLPALPDSGKYSAGFDPVVLEGMVDLLTNTTLPTYTDSYNQGLAITPLMNAARIADQLGYAQARDTLVATIQARLEDWFTAQDGKTTFLFYYDADWTTLIGYPAGYGSDSALNDHHFHYGYFLQAAALVEQFNPGWAAGYGGMVELLAKDVANADRTDPRFPFLRNFNPYCGHSWADGLDADPSGNNEECSSESMQFNTGLILWGTATGNTQLRDLGVYLYSTELSAIEEYWFDVNHRTFQPGYGSSMVSQIWGAGYLDTTWWTSQPAATYEIEMWPMNGGSLYLGRHPDYVQTVWNELTAKEPGLLTDTVNANYWYFTVWSYLAFTDPQLALQLYNAYPDPVLKAGESNAQGYHWLHTLDVLGQVQSGITADYPVAAVFTKAGANTYVATNFSAQALAVTFSDGYVLTVPPQATATSADLAATATLTASSAQVPAGGTVTLTAAVTGAGITQVAFYQDSTLLGVVAPPYTFTTAALAAGLPHFYAKVFVGSSFNLSNPVVVQVGGQTPYGGTAPTLPGTLQAADYDVFAGGLGQGVTYLDTTPGNSGTFRPTEWVDAYVDPVEGDVVEYIDSGEWLTYTVNVTQAGPYTVTVDTTSGTPGGGGPFWFALDGAQISPDIQVPYTDANWSTWVSTVVPGDVVLPAGTQVLKVMFGAGGFNLGLMRFALDVPSAPSIVTQPSGRTVAAGATATFTVTAGGTTPLTYQWQKNGTAIPGATAASYTTPAATLADSGATFAVVVTNTLGSTTSQNATLTVVPPAAPPAITAQPQSVTVSVGMPATFTVTAAGTGPLTYQWRRNDTALAGATSASYTTPVTTSADGGATFSVVVTNAAGSVASSEAVLTLGTTPVAPAITAQPAGATVARGQTATFTAAADGSPAPALQWQRNVGGTWTVLAGATGSTCTTAATTDADNGASFRLVATNATGSATSSAATLTVTDPTLILIDNFNSATRWAAQINSLGLPITTSGGLFNLEGNADLYFFFNDGSTPDSMTTYLDTSLVGLTDLVLGMEGGSGGEEADVTVVLNDGADHALGLASYGTLTTSYQNLSIPLSAFNADLATIAYLRIEGRGIAKTIRIDNLSVVATGPVAPRSLDLNGDGTVNVLDLAFLASVYGTDNAAAELDGNDVVDDGDITLLLAGF